MLGAISHVDTFDYKPMLEKMHGQIFRHRSATRSACRR
jgi:hypothetical protein